MSLKAVRHAKQRLAPDPRNLHWANDTNKFGFKMMEKMGWSQGKGLGAKEDGVQEHVKVRLKENTLGVGATKKSIDNWLGNTDAFSKLLAELNDRVENDKQSSEENGDGSSNSPSNGDSSESDTDNSDKDDDESARSTSKSSKKSGKEKKSKKEKKNKEKTEKIDGKDKNDKKDKKEKKEKKQKEKKEKKDKHEKKDKKSKKEKSSSDDDSEDKSTLRAAINGRKASRHKYLKNKHAALQNSERLNEILGIKSETASPTASGMSTPVVEEPMTSTDIFAARLQQSSVSTTNDSTNEDHPRPVFGGLGFATSQGIGASGYSRGIRGLGFVKATVSAGPSTELSKSAEEQTTTTSTTIETVTITTVGSNINVSTEGDKKSSKDKKEKKEKKEKKDKEDKKEKKEKKDKKRKAEDVEVSASKKSKK